MIERRLDALEVGVVFHRHDSWPAGLSGPFEVVEQCGALTRCKLVTEDVSFDIHGHLIVLVDE
jgi:hypothetical protein